jgi:predicted  nucleic acid-binding Zn-ribbon protein
MANIYPSVDSMPGYFTDPESELYKLYLDKKYVNSDSLKKYYTIDETNSKLSTELQSVSNNINSLKQTVDSLSTKSSDYALNSELSSVKTTLTTLEAIVNILKNNESKYALQAELTPIQSTLTTLSSKIDGLSTKSNDYALKSELTTLSNNFTSLSSIIDTLSEKYALKSELTTVTKNLDSLTTTVGNLSTSATTYAVKEELTTISTTLVDLKKTVENLSKETPTYALKDSLATVANNLFALTSTVQNLSTSSSTYALKDSLTVVSNNLSTLTNTVNTLSQNASKYALIGSSYTKKESDDTFETKGNYALKTSTLSCDPLTGLCSLPAGNKGYLDVNGRVKATSFGLMNSTFTTNGNDIFLNTNGASNIFLRPNGDGNPLNQVVVGPTNTNFNTISATGATIFNLNVTNGFNAPKAFADLYGVNLGANGIVSKGPININTATTNSWTLRQSTDGKLCFALNGTNKICINGNGAIVAPTIAFTAQ